VTEKDLLDGVDVKGRRLLLMKWAEADKFPAALLQRNGAADEFYNVDRLKDAASDIAAIT
jgi:hypothetical protein